MGEVNRNWILRTKQGKYVFRQVLSYEHYRSPRDLEFEFRYLDRLRTDGFPYRVPAPIPAVSGKLFKNIRGHYYWVYQFIDGEVIESLDGSHLVQLAKLLATYHHKIEKSRLENQVSRSDVFSRRYILKEMGEFRAEVLRTPRNRRRDTTFNEESSKLIPILKSLDESPYRSLGWYHIHQDIGPGNLIWKRDRLAGLIDFENVSRTRKPVIKDVASTLQFTCSDRKAGRGLDLDLAKTFLRSYLKLHPLPKKEIQLIPDLLVSGLIEDFEFEYWKLRNDPERARVERLTHYSTSAQWTFANREKLARDFFS